MGNIDFQTTADGDLYLTPSCDIVSTNSICQAVRIHLLWFLGEWRLGPSLGFPYFEEVLRKNYNEARIKHYIRTTVMGVEGVTSVSQIDFQVDHQNRGAMISVAFHSGEEALRVEVEIDAKIRSHT